MMPSSLEESIKKSGIIIHDQEVTNAQSSRAPNAPEGGVDEGLNYSAPTKLNQWPHEPLHE